MIDEERELREALRSRGASVPVGRADEPGLGRRLIATRRRRRARLIGGAVSLALVVAVGLVGASKEDRSHVVVGPDPSSTTTVVEPNTTTVDQTSLDTTPLPPPPSTPVSGPPGPSVPPGSSPTTVGRTTVPTALPPVPDDAVWPPPGSATVFPTADRAAADFARRFLAMASPQLSPAQVTGSDATVAIRAFPTGGVTTLATLRRADPRGWVVLGSAAPDIQVDRPTSGSTVASPLPVSGRALAFEGRVVVEVRQDGTTAPIGRGVGNGGGTEMLPFESTVTFPAPSARRGTVVVSEPRADVGPGGADLGPAAATVVRVGF